MNWWISLLSKRLSAIAAEINTKSIIDIGTDHAYIPIYTCQQGITNRAIACDINKGPLDIARKNIKSAGLEHMIETRLSNGFENVKPGEAESAILAGMGGHLIINILKSASTVISKLEYLILQPQLDIPDVRRYIHKIAFKIDKERIIEDSGKIYNIIVCTKGNDENYTEANYVIGKKLIENPCETFVKYLKKQINSLKKIEYSVKNADSGGKARLLEVQNLINAYTDALKDVGYDY